MPSLDTEKIYKKKISRFIKFSLFLREEFSSEELAEAALCSGEDHRCNLFLPTLVNVLFLHKPVRILVVGLFLNILPNKCIV